MTIFHIDNDGDEVCDECGKVIVHDCVHADANHDGVCDKNCGQTDMAVTHKAEDDANHDGKCDVCGGDMTEVDEGATFPPIDLPS